MGIPYDTIKDWHKTPWWKEQMVKIREELDTKIASKIDTVVEKALEGVIERVQDGEHILDSKTGQVIRIPVKTRDLTQAVKVLSDRQDILIGRQKVEQATNQTIHEKLTMLAEQFASFAGKQKKPEIVEATFEMLEDSDAEQDEEASSVYEGSSPQSDNS